MHPIPATCDAYFFVTRLPVQYKSKELFNTSQIPIHNIQYIWKTVYSLLSYTVFGQINKDRLLRIFLESSVTLK